MFNSLIEIGHYFNSSANGISLRYLSTQIALYRLQPGDFLCRYTSIGLHPAFLSEVDSVVTDINELLREASERRQQDVFVIDHDGTLLSLLRSSSTSMQVYVAWSILARRLLGGVELLQLFCLPVSLDEVARRWTKFAQAEAELWERKQEAEDRRSRARDRMVQDAYEQRKLVQSKQELVRKKTAEIAAARFQFLTTTVDSRSPSLASKPRAHSRKFCGVIEKRWRRSMLRSPSNRALAAYYDFEPVTFASTLPRLPSELFNISSSPYSALRVDHAPMESLTRWEQARTSLDLWVQQIEARIHAQAVSGPRYNVVEGIGVVWRDCPPD
ncbi:hypothetical protein B0H11DRAFT_1910233 [Mycena galericulata]|nr:hypothetical protein B0H11DRAFT_1910233 [Mycena galericulata]